MAGYLRQNIGPSSNSANSVGSITTPNLNFSENTQQGSLLVCIVSANVRDIPNASVAISTPVSTDGTTWELAVSSYWLYPEGEYGGGSSSGSIAIYYAANADVMNTGTATTATATTNANLDDFENLSVDCMLYEFPNVGYPVAYETTSQGYGGYPSTPNIEISQTCLILDVASAFATTLGPPPSPGYYLVTSWICGDMGVGVQYILNQTSGAISTAFATSVTGYWSCSAVAFADNVSGSVSPEALNITSAVSAVFATTNPTPSALNIIAALGSISVVATADAIATSVGMVSGVAVVWAGLGINYGNVVSGSSGLPPSVRTTNFYVRWQGYLIPSISGTYNVGVNSEDGCNLYIGSDAVIQHIDFTQSAFPMLAYTQSSQITLEAGVSYQIVLEWQHENSSSYECQLIWTPPGGFPELIPVGNMNNGVSSTPGLLNGYWWNLTTPSTSSNLPKLINVQLKARLTTDDAAVTPIFTGASLDQL